MEPIIRIEHLTHTYSAGTPFQRSAVEDVSIDVMPGEFLGIIGPTGCGKSTLLRCMNGLEPIEKGTISYCGETVDGRSKNIMEIRQKVGMVFQSFNLIDELNVFENIELPLTYLKIPADERKRRVNEIMQRMNISHRAKHYPQQLSGGQQQRVAIARAVVSGPKIILADEPTGNLDSKNGQEVMELLTELNKEGTTIVMVTHSQRDAGFASRVINLFDGQIVASIAEM